MKRIILATNNRHKIREIKDIARNFGYRILTLYDIGFKKEIKETGQTITDNARIKSRAVRRYIKNEFIISDDTGLEVDFLAKAPGVFSSRFAGPGCTYEDNYRKLLWLLREVPWNKRKSVFKTAVCIITPEGKEKIVEGKVKGYITFFPKGNNGFGYDPVFYLPSKKKTYAELTMKEKNSVSHRKKAIIKAFHYLKTYFNRKSLLTKI